jgi:hypothetical protein
VAACFISEGFFPSFPGGYPAFLANLDFSFCGEEFSAEFFEDAALPSYAILRCAPFLNLFHKSAAMFFLWIHKPCKVEKAHLLSQ